MLKQIRIYWNILLVRFGIRSIMPKDAMRMKEVRECGEVMIPIEKRDNLFLDRHPMHGRKSVVEKLYMVAAELKKEGYGLHVFQIYRSPEEQAGRKESVRKELRKSHPDLSQEDYERLVDLNVAGVGGGHQSGGAVDLTICDKDGNDLDMGTRYLEHNNKTITESKHIESEQKLYRRILKEEMQRAGFINYPAEWWHYAYGDRMWAVYKNKGYAIYDNITFSF